MTAGQSKHRNTVAHWDGRRQLIEDLYRTMSLRELGDFLDCSYRTVALHLKRWGVEMRRPGGPNNRRGAKG